MAHTETPKFVKIKKYLVNADQVLHAYEDTDYSTGGKGEGVRIEFIRKGSLFIYDVSLEAVQSALNGAPF